MPPEQRGHEGGSEAQEGSTGEPFRPAALPTHAAGSGAFFFSVHRGVGSVLLESAQGKRGTHTGLHRPDSAKIPRRVVEGLRHVSLHVPATFRLFAVRPDFRA